MCFTRVVVSKVMGYKALGLGQKEFAALVMKKEGGRRPDIAAVSQRH